MVETNSRSQLRLQFKRGDSFMQAVFLHGGWRCGSTYVWNKFRDLDDVTGFYEPFRERLASFTTESLLGDTHTQWDSRHPPLRDAYFAEYLPLLGARGVRNYEERFALERYFVGLDQSLDELDYLRSLVGHATDQGKRAVLGFSRSLGRVGAIKRYVTGQHLVLMRDPVQQWLSSRSYATSRDRSYFEVCQFLILALATPGSAAAALAEQLHIPRPPAGLFRDQYRFMRRHCRTLDDEQSYRAFLAVYVLSYLEAIAYADLIIDMDLLSVSAAYRRSIERPIAQMTGLTLDLGDCDCPARDATDVGVDFARINDEVLEQIDQLRDAPAREELTCSWNNWGTLLRKLNATGGALPARNAAPMIELEEVARPWWGKRVFTRISIL
jgi:hypothetical protein